MADASGPGSFQDRPKIIGRYNALEFGDDDGWPVVRRYVGHALVISSGRIASAQISEEVAETQRLPIDDTRVLLWLHDHFEDLSATELRAIETLLTAPAAGGDQRPESPLAITEFVDRSRDGGIDIDWSKEVIIRIPPKALRA